ncbi:MAG TPA: ArsI/CadI family heavy metal resistance metalloenzyme [Verrucomicrobiae bacterium]|nr:ArsI/CadI family heavy metal resistance metalloenzyme [Verrucomicrobiae bacterium]
MKTHLNLATTDLNKSVSFYSTLLNTKPSKNLADYALFISDEPGLELALDLRDSVTPTLDAHFGIYVETTQHVETAIARLEAAGLADAVQREDTCCYANQTKVWVTDPDGRRWEIYTVHDDTAERDNAATQCCSA